MRKSLYLVQGETSKQKEEYVGCISNIVQPPANFYFSA